MNDLLKKNDAEDTSLSFSDALARTVLNSLSAHIAILDETGIILETNNAWRNYSSRSGMPEDYDYRKINYLEVCDATRDNDSADARKVAEGLRAVINGDIDEFLYDYPCHSETSRHWYYMKAIRMSGPEPIRVVVSHEDITALKLTEEALNQSRESLTEQKQSLEEANIALKVLLKQREEDRLELEKKVLNNVKDLVRLLIPISTILSLPCCNGFPMPKYYSHPRRCRWRHLSKMGKPARKLPTY
jgi:hypothetical protein